MDNCTDISSLEDELGQIESVEQIYPGIYYLIAKSDDEPLAAEYYAVADTPIISPEAKAYGRKLHGWRLFSIQDDTSGWRIIDYELGKYRVKNHLPQEQSLHDVALDAAEYHPEYFGAYPVPFCTPRGYTTRHWILENGIYWIETDQCEEVLAVCYPVWTAELSVLSEKIGEQAEFDKRHGIQQTLGYLFFSSQASCIPIYELMQTRTKTWGGTVIDKPALMNAIWKYIPGYAVTMNRREQAGVNDVLSMMLMDLGIDVDPQILQDRMISLSPDTGEDYQLFKRFANGKRNIHQGLYRT